MEKFLNPRGFHILAALDEVAADHHSTPGKVALAWVGVNGREERQIVENVMEQFGDAWRTEWLRLRGLQKWADYLRSLEKREEEESLCVNM